MMDVNVLEFDCAPHFSRMSVTTILPFVVLIITQPSCVYSDYKYYKAVFKATQRHMCSDLTPNKSEISHKNAKTLIMCHKCTVLNSSESIQCRNSSLLLDVNLCCIFHLDCCVCILHNMNRQLPSCCDNITKT